VVSTSVFGLKRRDTPVVLLENIALANDLPFTRKKSLLRETHIAPPYFG
jgi:hypothetical protein